jgi:hypothetical protein
VRGRFGQVRALRTLVCETGCIIMDAKAARVLPASCRVTDAADIRGLNGPIAGDDGRTRCGTLGGDASSERNPESLETRGVLLRSSEPEAFPSFQSSGETLNEKSHLRRSVSLSCLEGLPRRLCWRELAVLLSSAPDINGQLRERRSGSNEFLFKRTRSEATMHASFLLDMPVHVSETFSHVLLDEVAQEFGRVAVLQPAWTAGAHMMRSDALATAAVCAPSMTGRGSLPGPARVLPAHHWAPPQRPKMVPDGHLKRSNSIDSLRGCQHEASQAQSARREALRRFRHLLMLQKLEQHEDSPLSTPRETTENIPDAAVEDDEIVMHGAALSVAPDDRAEPSPAVSLRVESASPAEPAIVRPQCAGRATEALAQSVDRSAASLRRERHVMGLSARDVPSAASHAKTGSSSAALVVPWRKRWALLWYDQASRPTVTVRTIVRSMVYCLYESLCFWGHRDLGRTLKLALETCLDELLPPGKLSCRRKVLEYLVPCGCGSYVLWYLQRRRIVAGKPALYQLPRFHWTHLRTWRSAAFTVTYRMLRLAVIYRFFLKFGTPLYRLATLLALVLSFFRAEILSDLFRIRQWPRYISFVQGTRTVIRSVVYAAAFSIPLERFGSAFAISRRRANIRKAIFFGTVMLSSRVRHFVRQMRRVFESKSLRGARLLATHGVSWT